MDDVWKYRQATTQTEYLRATGLNVTESMMNKWINQMNKIHSGDGRTSQKNNRQGGTHSVKNQERNVSLKGVWQLRGLKALHWHQHMKSASLLQEKCDCDSARVMWHPYLYYQHCSVHNVILVTYSHGNVFLFLRDKVKKVNSLDGGLSPHKSLLLERKYTVCDTLKKGTRLYVRTLWG